MCDDCYRDIVGDLRQTAPEFPESLETPVVLVNSDKQVKAGNRKAQEVLGKKIASIADRLSGELIARVNSYLPGGCGKTEHCKACTIRMSVEETLKTEKSIEKRAAYLDIKTDKGPVRMRYNISTGKVQGLILLRIDEVSTASLQ